MKAVNLTRNKELAYNVTEACSLFERMRGLLGRQKLEQGESLWIRPCNSIHSIGMKFPIDVIFLDSENTVVAIRNQMPAYRITGVYFRASSVLELPAGILRETNTQVGDRIDIV
jgi:uncharacterized membrane protein (UPF0127 family)